MGKVLIIDDEENNRLLLATLLEYAGHIPLEAAAGLAGVETAARELPDAVIVDLALRDITGVEVIRRLREDPRTATVAIALYTATQLTPALNELVELYSIRSIIPKPGDPHQILAAFAKLLPELR